eukprot:Clim_evm101s11 gene=Clim_evmTU101s11
MVDQANVMPHKHSTVLRLSALRKQFTASGRNGTQNKKMATSFAGLGHQYAPLESKDQFIDAGIRRFVAASTLETTLEAPKLRLETLKSLDHAFKPPQVYISLVKGAVLGPLTAEKREKIPEAFAVVVAKDISYNTTKAIFQQYAINHMKPLIAERLMTDVSAEAIRILDKDGASFAATYYAIFKAGCYAATLTHAAIYAVEQFVEIAKVYLAPKETIPTKPVDAKRKAFVDVSAEHMSRFLGSVLLSGIGAALGTMISPGRGTFVGALVGDSILYVF